MSGVRTPRFNVGKVYLERSAQKWRMIDAEDYPTGNEFEGFCEELESFLDGYFLALGLEDAPAYAQGDFFGEQTEAVHFEDRAHLSERFVQAIQHWLSAPKRSNWRVLIPGNRRSENYIVVYNDAVVLAPEIKSLSEAISED